MAAICTTATSYLPTVCNFRLSKVSPKVRLSDHQAFLLSSSISFLTLAIFCYFLPFIVVLSNYWSCSLQRRNISAYVRRSWSEEKESDASHSDSMPSNSCGEGFFFREFGYLCDSCFFYLAVIYLLVLLYCFGRRWHWKVFGRRRKKEFCAYIDNWDWGCSFICLFCAFSWW